MAANDVPEADICGIGKSRQEFLRERGFAAGDFASGAQQEFHKSASCSPTSTGFRARVTQPRRSDFATVVGGSASGSRTPMSVAYRLPSRARQKSSSAQIA